MKVELARLHVEICITLHLTPTLFHGLVQDDCRYGRQVAFVKFSASLGSDGTRLTQRDFMAIWEI